MLQLLLKRYRRDLFEILNVGSLWGLAVHIASPDRLGNKMADLWPFLISTMKYCYRYFAESNERIFWNFLLSLCILPLQTDLKTEVFSSFYLGSYSLLSEFLLLVNFFVSTRIYFTQLVR